MASTNKKNKAKNTVNPETEEPDIHQEDSLEKPIEDNTMTESQDISGISDSAVQAGVIDGIDLNKQEKLHSVNKKDQKRLVRECCESAMENDRQIGEAKKEYEKITSRLTDIQKIDIQAEMRGEETKISLLFIHAQDTIMTITSEINMATEMLEMYKLIHGKGGRA